LFAGCAGLGPPDPRAAIDAALADLAAADFRFEPDVAFAEDRFVVCEGVSCSELKTVHGRRTVLIAREVFQSPSRLRATLLDMWGRYQQPRAPSTADQARSALRILQDGPRAGIDDTQLLRDTHHTYRQLYNSMKPAQRAELPRPDDLAYP
jgi:hypothetical protein